MAATLSAEFTERYATEDETADTLGVLASTLRTWSARRTGPSGRLRLGRKIYYRRDAILAWLESQEAAPAMQRGA